MATGQDKRPIRAEDYWDLKSIHDPRLTKDGRIAAYFVERADKGKDHYHRAIHVTDLAGQRTGVLENPGDGARGLALSPDGTQVAWVATRDNLSHVSVARLEDILAQTHDGPSGSVDVKILFERQDPL